MKYTPGVCSWPTYQRKIPLAICPLMTVLPRTSVTCTSDIPSELAPILIFNNELNGFGQTFRDSLCSRVPSTDCNDCPFTQISPSDSLTVETSASVFKAWNNESPSIVQRVSVRCCALNSSVAILPEPVMGFVEP